MRGAAYGAGSGGLASEVGEVGDGGGPDIAGFGNQVKNGVPLPNTPFMSALWDPVAKALAAVWTGKQSVDAALTDAQAAAEKNVAQLK